MLYLSMKGYLDWKRSSKWLESWGGLLGTKNHPNDLFNQGMLLLGLNHFLIYKMVSEVMAAEGSNALPPKCSTNNKEMTKDTNK